jgi:predicted nucleotidyltransferase
VPRRDTSRRSLGATALGSLVEANRDQIRSLVQQHRGRAVWVFGSVARGEAGGTSDVDFLVEFADGSSLFDLIHLQDALRELLGRNVDIVSIGALRARDQRLRDEAVPL